MTVIARMKKEMESADGRVRAFAVALTAVAFGIVAAAVIFFPTNANFWTVGALAVVAAFAERGTVRLARDTEQSISIIPTLFAAVLFGPLGSLIVAAASMAGEFTRREAWHFDKPHLRLAIYTSSRTISGAVAGVVAFELGSTGASGLSNIVLAAMFAAVAAEAIDALIASATLHLRGRQRGTVVLRTFAPILGLSIVLYTPVVAVLAFAYRELSPWALPLFLLPALGAQRLFGLYQEQRELAEELAATNARLERANLSFAAGLVATLDARDRYTAGHSAAVAIYSRDIARRMEFSADDQQKAYLCGLVHDIGKIGLPPGLLEKTGPLTLEERRLMQEHSAIAERILAKVDGYADIARVVRHHHERIDGNGYPDGLEGNEIPPLSRIIAVADAYDAMTSDRPYREAMPSRVARLRLAQAVETQFDTAVVAAFEALLTSSDDAYRRGDGEDFEIVGREDRSKIFLVA
jgi:HD domain